MNIIDKEGENRKVKVAPLFLFKGNINKAIEFISSIQEYVIANAFCFTDNKEKIIFIKLYMKKSP